MFLTLTFNLRIKNREKIFRGFFVKVLMKLFQKFPGFGAEPRELKKNLEKKFLSGNNFSFLLNSNV